MAVTDDLRRARAELTMIHAEPFNAEAPPEGLASAITPTGQHYVRSNFPLPPHDGTLEIGGAVENPTTLTLDDLRAMPAVERVVTLECAGNGRLAMKPLPIGEPWGDYAVSTASWKGALLSDVLERVRPAANGVEVRFEGADHGTYILHPVLGETDAADLTFVRSLSLADAADPNAEILLAYEMNGEPLSADHGAPFRLIVPHWFAVASVKWLKRVDVLDEPFVGEFQTGHYIYEWPDRPHEPVTLMRVRARITEPARGATIPAGTHTVRGKAWSGSGPVAAVEVSFTGEGEWMPAQLEPPAGPYQWQEWSIDWDVPTPGRYSIRARATDAAGEVQPEIPPWNRLGYGNNAVELVYVDVR
jgi:DMSO/TMAO reductase YedYZ molybdopterin-dependent catalytic subunit